MFKLSTGLAKMMAGIGGLNNTLATNGLFTSDVTGWTLTGGGTLAHDNEVLDAGYKCASIEDDGTGGAQVDNDAAMTVKVGQLYCVTVDIKQIAASGLVIELWSGTNGTGTQYTTYTPFPAIDGTWQSYEIFFRPSLTTLFVNFSMVTASGHIHVDNLSVHRASASIKEIFKDSKLEIRSGTQPPTADDIATGTLICTFYSDGISAGLEFDEATTNFASKKTTETWSGTVATTGSVGWFRLMNIADAGTLNTNDARLDGSVGLIGGSEDLLIETTELGAGEVKTISTFKLTVPLT